MPKITVTGTGVQTVDVSPGRTIYIASSGTYTATIYVRYATAPGVFVDYATPLTLSAPGELTVVNVGAHSELAIDCTAYTSGTATIIANPEALQERGR
jgi:hypothetical protein